ncbi:MAG: hypothetical protein JOY81_03985, partial [Alphaproteobacteria bacterium]|nr:hypothetical protein [Alphaproteobacteria bacterium]
NFDGSRYSGIATIRMESDAECHIHWEAGSTTRGICMLVGNVFSVSYQMNGRQGLAVYVVRADGTLDGRWTLEGARSVGTDRLTPRR